MKKLFSRFKHSMRIPASTSDPTPAATAGQVGSMQTPARGKLQKRVDCYILHRNAPVEDLPPEVRHHLLSMLELETLWALVHASPVYHQQDLSARRRLLCSGLETTLRSATSDACAVYQSRLVDFSHSRTKEEVNMFL
ncbi:hypothetical protein AFLA70_307g001680 [Aspergillus flavus AF70]|nr:hypothetical protein AFLA70_307g001680 [Aspergillus flavus AF70]